MMKYIKHLLSFDEFFWKKKNLTDYLLKSNQLMKRISKSKHFNFTKKFVCLRKFEFFFSKELQFPARPNLLYFPEKTTKVVSDYKWSSKDHGKNLAPAILVNFCYIIVLKHHAWGYYSTRHYKILTRALIWWGSCWKFLTSTNSA